MRDAEDIEIVNFDASLLTSMGGVAVDHDDMASPWVKTPWLDANDVFVLDGSVPDQVTLTRVLFVASRAVQGAKGGGVAGNEVRALADEAGALTMARNLFGAGSSGGGNQQQGLNTLRGSALSGGGQQQIANRIGSQVGRAKIGRASCRERV